MNNSSASALESNHASSRTKAPKSNGSMSKNSRKNNPLSSAAKPHTETTVFLTTERNTFESNSTSHNALRPWPFPTGIQAE